MAHTICCGYQTEPYPPIRVIWSDERPFSSDERPNWSDGRGFSSDGRATSSDGPPFWSDGRPSPSHGRPILSDERPTSSHGRATSSDEQPSWSDGPGVPSDGRLNWSDIRPKGVVIPLVPLVGRALDRMPVRRWPRHHLPTTCLQPDHLQQPLERSTTHLQIDKRPASGRLAWARRADYGSSDPVAHEY